MKRPKVVAGIPVYNGQKFLAQRLENLLAINYSNLEILISDNASTDATPDICQTYQNKNGNIRYVRHETHRSPGENFEYVLKNAGADYFFFAAHDDLNPPNYVETCLQTLEKNPQCVACFSAIRFIDQENRLVQQDDKDTIIKLEPDFTALKRIRYFMLGPSAWLVYSFFKYQSMDPRLFTVAKTFRPPHYEYPWVLGLLVTGAVCGTEETHFVYRVKSGMSAPAGVCQPMDAEDGIERIHAFLDALQHYSRKPGEIKKYRGALLFAVLQSHGGCKDWYQMTKRGLKLPLLRSYLTEKKWDLVAFFLLMKIMKIKPLRILCRQRIYG